MEGQGGDGWRMIVGVDITRRMISEKGGDTCFPHFAGQPAVQNVRLVEMGEDEWENLEIIKVNFVNFKGDLTLIVL